MRSIKLLSAVVLAATCVGAVQAQERNIVREGTKAFYAANRLTLPHPPAEIYLLEFKGDTVVNGVTYKKQYTTYRSKSTGELVTYVRNLVREEGRKVYAIQADGPNVDDLEYGIAKVFPGPYFEKTGEYKIYDFEEPEAFFGSLYRNYQDDGIDTGKSGKEIYYYDFENGNPEQGNAKFTWVKENNSGKEHSKLRIDYEGTVGDDVPLMSFVEGIGLCDGGVGEKGCYGWANHYGVGPAYLGSGNFINLCLGLYIYFDEQGEVEYVNNNIYDDDPYDPIKNAYDHLVEGIKKVEQTGINDVAVNGTDRPANVYNLQGQVVRRNVTAQDATQGLPAGIYIHGGKKVVVK